MRVIRKTKTSLQGKKCISVTTACSVNVTFVLEYLNTICIFTASLSSYGKRVKGSKNFVCFFYHGVTELFAEYLSDKRGLITHAENNRGRLS